MSTLLTDNNAAILQHGFGKPFADLIANICTTLDTVGGDETAVFASVSSNEGTADFELSSDGSTSTLTLTGVDATTCTLVMTGGASSAGFTVYGDSGTYMSLLCDATAAYITFAGSTGECEIRLTPNKADALSFTDSLAHFLVFDTTTGSKGVVQGGNAGEATTLKTIVGKKTGIADNSATDILTVTVPNVNAAAAIRLTLVGSLGTGTDTFESTRVAIGTVVIARQAGANVVPTAVALTNAGIATVSGGGTLTLAYGVSAVAGAVGATNTFTIQVTLVVTGTITTHQCVYLAELINAETGGVTMATA